MVGAPVLVGLLGAVYYAQAKDIIQSEMLLYDANYPIRYSTHTRALEPHWHHMELAESPVFLSQLASNLQVAGLFDDAVAPEVLRNIFACQDKRGRSGPILVTVNESSTNRAQRALNIWRETYTLEAPRHRARYLLHEMRAELPGRLDRQREMEAVLSGLESLIQKELISVDHDANYLDALYDRRVSIKLDQIMEDFRGQFHDELMTYFHARMEGLEVHASPKVLETAHIMMLDGLDKLFSEQEIIYYPVKNLVKVFSLSFTALLFTATYIVFSDWFLKRFTRNRAGV